MDNYSSGRGGGLQIFLAVKRAVPTNDSGSKCPLWSSHLQTIMALFNVQLLIVCIAQSKLFQLHTVTCLEYFLIAKMKKDNVPLLA